MVSPWLWLAALGAPAAVSAQAPRVPSPTLEFNVSVSLAALNNRGKWSDWATTYANTQGAGNGTIAEGPARLVASDRRPELSLVAAARAVYVYGDLGPEGSLGMNELSFRFAGEQPANRAADADTGLIGHAALDMFKYFEGSYASLWMSFDAEAPSVERVVVTTGIETDATALADVNVTTWRFVEDGELSARFTWRDYRPDLGYAGWNTTASYAAALGDGTLRAVAERADGAVSGHAGAVLVQVPANSSWVALNVTRGPRFGGVFITAEPKIEGYPADTLSTYGTHYAPDDLQWFRSLDPRQRYNLSISAGVDTDRPDAPVALTSITFYGGHAADGTGNGTGIPSPGRPGQGDGDGDGAGGGGAGAGKTTNIGAIVGGVVGGVLGAALLAALAWFLVRRRRQERQAREGLPRLEIDDAPVTPYAGRAPSPGSGFGYDEKGRPVPMPGTKAALVAQEAQPLSPAPRPRALDGGAAPEPDAETAMDPPEYNPAWQGGAAAARSPAASAPTATATATSATAVSPAAAPGDKKLM